MPFLSRLATYAAGIGVLVRGVQRAPLAAAQLLLRPGSRRRIRLRSGMTLVVRGPMDLWIVKETCLDGAYDEVARGEDVLTILDVGAGIGDYAVHAARRWPAATIFAFEPFPESFGLLEENVRLNGAANVRVFETAVTAAEGPATLHRGRTAAEHGTLQTAAHAGGEPVAATTLARIFEDNQIERCDLLKMDVEGAEFEILLEAGAALLARIRALCVEVHEGPGRSRETLAAHLRSHGFDVRLRPSPVHAHLALLDGTRRALRA